MSILQHRLPASQLAMNTYCQKFRTKESRSSFHGKLLSCKNVDLNHKKRFAIPRCNATKASHKAVDRVDIFPISITRRKCLTPTASKHSCLETSTHNPEAEDKFDEKQDEVDQTILEPRKISRREMHDGGYQSELLSLALPAIVGQAIDPITQLAETAYIGRLGAVELASAGVSVTIFNIISKLFNIPLLSITTSFVAEDITKNACQHLVSDSNQEYLEEKRDSVEMSRRPQLASVSTALLLAIAIGALEGLSLFFGAGQFLKLLGIASTSSMHNPARQFLSLRALGAPAVVLSLAIQGIFRGFKDTRTPLLCLGFGNLSALCLLPILVYALQLGLVGAAIATVASQYIVTGLLVWALSRKVVILPPKIQDLEFGGYIKSGSLLLGRTLSVLVTMTLGTSMAARQGPLAMAAHQICLQVWLAVSLLSDALALSAQALIASSFAKRDYQRVKDITYFVLKTGMFIGISLAIFLGVSFGSLAQLFTKDAEVLQLVRTGILFVSASQPINSLAFIFDGLHYGVSDFKYSACSMMAVGTVSSIFLLYAPSMFGLHGVWSGLVLFMVLRMMAGFIRLQWKNGPWQFLQKDFLIAKVNC